MTKILLFGNDEECIYLIQGGLELYDAYDIKVENYNFKNLKLTLKNFYPNVVIITATSSTKTNFTLINKIREKDKAVIIVMIEFDKILPKKIIKAYKSGIDVYIKKPFIVDEIHAQIQSLLQRLNNSTNNIYNSERIIHIGNSKFNFINNTLAINSIKQKLTNKEASLFALLCHQSNTLIPREKILIKLWGKNDFYSSRSLDVFLCKLRKYIKADDKVKIITIKGKGIMMCVDCL